MFILLACNNPFPGYTKTDSGLWYKILYMGEGEKNVTNGDFVNARLIYKTMGDTIIFDTKWTSIDGFKIFEAGEKKSTTDEAICLLREGDSATFILEQSFIQLDTFRIELDNKVKQIKLDIKVDRIFNPKEFKAAKQKLEWMHDFEMIEQSALLKYLSANSIARKNYRQGIYFIEEKKGKGNRPKTGDAVTVNYKGYFTDGTMFDNTYEMEALFTFNLGDPGQVIPGFDTGLRLMREKGKAKFIIPSQLGFGDKGSATGIVPPFTSLIYEVELVKIN